MDCGRWRYRKVYNETPISQKGILTPKGVKALASSMAQDSGVGNCSAVTGGDDMSEGQWKFQS